LFDLVLIFLVVVPCLEELDHCKLPQKSMKINEKIHFPPFGEVFCCEMLLEGGGGGGYLAP
jgi:hypothetical protein